jgi:hypothetical protein
MADRQWCLGVCLVATSKTQEQAVVHGSVFRSFTCQAIFLISDGNAINLPESFSATYQRDTNIDKRTLEALQKKEKG